MHCHPFDACNDGALTPLQRVIKIGNNDDVLGEETDCLEGIAVKAEETLTSTSRAPHLSAACLICAKLCVAEN